MRWTIFLGLAVALAACGGGDGGTQPNGFPDLTGNWRLSYTISDPTSRVTCVRSGSLVLRQTGSTLTGYLSLSGTCNDDGTSYVGGSFSGGSVSDGSIGFEDPECRYQATLSASRASLGGAVDCPSMYFSGRDCHMSGSWSASRQM